MDAADTTQKQEGQRQQVSSRPLPLLPRAWRHRLDRCCCRRRQHAAMPQRAAAAGLARQEAAATTAAAVTGEHHHYAAPEVEERVPHPYESEGLHRRESLKGEDLPEATK